MVLPIEVKRLKFQCKTGSSQGTTDRISLPAWYCWWGEYLAKKEGLMGTILAIMAVPALAATGIYDPPVMRNGHCIAEPGSFDALYCQAAPAPDRKRQAKR